MNKKRLYSEIVFYVQVLLLILEPFQSLIEMIQSNNGRKLLNESTSNLMKNSHFKMSWVILFKSVSGLIPNSFLTITSLLIMPLSSKIHQGGLFWLILRFKLTHGLKILNQESKSSDLLNLQKNLKWFSKMPFRLVFLSYLRILEKQLILCLNPFSKRSWSKLVHHIDWNLVTNNSTIQLILDFTWLQN